ncbi:MAG: DUF393 domain-containing protein [Verrucomicrobia bacterium]|nr:DUF393 domain-containing protein [Verrucomicrobiota bacterium]
MDAPLLLYDGDCGLCHGAVRFVLRHERDAVIRFAALQSATGQAWTRQAGTGMGTLLWIEAGEIHVRSDAVMLLARHLRWPWRWLGILRLVPRPLRDAGYDLVARHRMRWFGRATCDLPVTDNRDRFLK